MESSISFFDVVIATIEFQFVFFVSIVTENPTWGTSIKFVCVGLCMRVCMGVLFC